MSTTTRPLLMLAISIGALLVTLSAAQDVTAGSTCQSVLNAGIYNTFFTNVTATSSNQAHQAACTDYSAYTYDQYTKDSASGTAVGQAAAFNLAAKTFSWSFASSGSTAQLFQTESMFKEAQTKAAAYRVTNCGYSSVTSATDTRVQTLSHFIDRSVFEAYTSCLNLFASGVRVTQTSGFATKSLSLDIRFVPNQDGAVAFLTGISMYPPSGAVCTPFRREGGGFQSPPPPPPPPKSTRPPPPSSPPPPPLSPSNPFYFQLVPNAVYSIHCLLAPGAPADSRYTDINIYTSASGTFHALLFNDPAPTQLTAAYSRISALETSLVEASQKIGELAKALAATNSKVVTVDTRVTGVANSLTNTSGRIAALDNRVTTVDTRITAVDDRVTGVANSLTNTSARIIAALDNRVTTVDARVTAVDDRVTGVANSLASTSTQVAAVDGRLTTLFSAIDRRVNDVNGRVDNTNSLVANVDNKVNGVSNSVTTVSNSLSWLQSRVGSRASRVQTGSVYLDFCQHYGWCTGEKTRSLAASVSFPTAFSSTPTIMVSLSGIDGFKGWDAVVRVSLSADNITPQGFTVSATSWQLGCACSVTISYVAVLNDVTA